MLFYFIIFINGVLTIKLNKTDYLFIGIYAVIFCLLNIYDYVVNYDITKYIFSDGRTIQNISPPLKGYIIAIPVELAATFIVVFLFFLWIIPKFLIKKKNYFLFFTLAIFIATTFGVIVFTTWHWSENKPWETYPKLFTVLLNGLGLSAENAGLPLGILLAKKYYESQLHIVQIQKQQQESELKLLQAQLNPHFLFNNLNTLDALIEDRSKKAKQYIQNLSSLYRYLIESKDEEIVSLEKEIEMIRHYFYLIETRFGNTYRFNISEYIDTSNNKYLPTGALQILVENVVKHNKTTNENPIVTSIDVKKEEITIINTKTNTINNEVSFGTGLQNLKERYLLIFDKTIDIKESEEEFKVTIPIITLTKYDR
ncbi:histidine kinase [uncultured Dokdonia sp.]|uniref:sensor histidine kinase n=1 Tax=uncultured Dokdonia sp. TaxID=575653 RepID=UPI002625DCC8|nr:histidine kinase [uncultured Dokdonia sp.]